MFLQFLESVNDEFSYADIEGELYGAGYDSYMSGVVHISVALHLGFDPTEIHIRSEWLQQMMNRYNNTRLFTLICINPQSLHS